MKKVFIDTLYWIAIVNPNDSWEKAAKQAKDTLGDVLMITTDEVLTEFLTALSKSGEYLRKQAACFVRAILRNANVRVIPQSRESFIKGLSFYEQRADKKYSLTDCISMNVMKAESISDVLTHDHHFSQEGYNVLIQKKS